MSNKRQKRKKHKNLLRKWHRRIGLTASLFLLNLSVTGILLNHYEFFKLQSHYIQSDWLLDWYGVSPPATANCHRNDKLTACDLDQFIYFNNQFWQQTESHLIGVASNPDGIVVATANTLFFLTEQLNLIEQISLSETLGDSIKHITTYEQQIVVTTQTNQLAQLDVETLSWLPIKPSKPLQINGIQHSPSLSQKPLTEMSLSHIQADYRRRQITQLRFVQDLHSGRIFMLSGIIVNDIAAFTLILLAISGFFVWQRKKTSLP